MLGLLIAVGVIGLLLLAVPGGMEIGIIAVCVSLIGFWLQERKRKQAS